jgi:uncharacterized protein DUF3631
MTYTPVDLVEQYFRRYVVYPSEHALTAHALWIPHTYMMALWDITPRMGFFSPEPGSGKSRALEVSRRLAHNPMPTASITGASFIRMVHEGNHTIFIDELEGIYANAQARDANSVLTSVLNAGFESDAIAHRCEAKTNKPETFNIYAPVMLAGLNRAKLPDSLKSRMIAIHMKRRLPGDEIADFRKRYAEAEAKPIREALQEWCEQAQTNIDLDALTIPGDIRDRDADIWEPLFAVAYVAGGKWPDRVAEAAKWFVNARVDDSADSSGLRLLRDCESVLDQPHTRTCEPDWLRAQLFNMTDAPWSTWGKNGGGISTFMLKQWLKDYGIKPYSVKVAGDTVKGYHVKQFKEELARYPEPEPEGGGYRGYTGYHVDNKNNEVTEVTEVTEGMGSVAPITPPPEPNADFEERAAILEHDGGYSREEAEAIAAEEFDGWRDMPDGLRRYEPDAA